MKSRGGFQPYKGKAVMPGPALEAMKRGRTASGLNPMDVRRASQGLAARAAEHRTLSRKARKARPARKSR